MGNKAVNEPLISDKTLRTFVGYHLKRSFNVIQSDLIETLRPFDLRMLTYTALVLIVDNPGLNQSRLARVMEEITGRFPALLAGVSLGGGGSLDPEILVGRSSKLPGDREAALDAALGELVAYLEFEIKNHPRIEDPDGIRIEVNHVPGRGHLKETADG